jgi:hypothetical protein
VTEPDFGVGSIGVSSPRERQPGFDQQTARINTGDDTWRAFRRLCLDDGEPVSEVLGRLVDREVERRRPAPRPTTQRPSRPRADASTREHHTEETPPAKRRRPSSTSTRASTPTLFDP